MQLQDILFSQGFGTRRVCAGLIQQGLVQVYAGADDATPHTCMDSAADFAAAGLRFRVQGVDWAYYDKAYILPTPTATIRLSQSYFFAAVSNTGTMRK